MYENIFKKSLSLVAIFFSKLIFKIIQILLTITLEKTPVHRPVHTPVIYTFSCPFCKKRQNLKSVHECLLPNRLRNKSQFQKNSRMDGMLDSKSTSHGLQMHIRASSQPVVARYLQRRPYLACTSVCDKQERPTTDREVDVHE